MSDDAQSKKSWQAVVSERLSGLKPHFKTFLVHPASALVWITLFSLIVTEQYPFSHYPMYSSWGNNTHYFYVRNAEGPIQFRSVFRSSVPRAKKVYGSTYQGVVKEYQDKGIEATEVEMEAEAGRRLLATLRKSTTSDRKKKYADILDDDLTLVRVDVELEDGDFSFEERDIATAGPEPDSGA